MVADANKPPQPDTPGGGFTGYGAERESGAADAPPSSSSDAAPAAAWSEAFERFGEARDYAKYYVKARLDALRLSVRNLMLMVALGIVGAIAGGALLVTSVVLLCL